MRVALLAATLACAAPSAQQPVLALTPPADAARRAVTVAGIGSASARADVAVLRFSVESEGATVDEAVQRHQREVDRVAAVLRAAGVPDSAVVLDRLALGDDASAVEGPFRGGARTQDADPVTVSRAVSVRVTDLAAVVGLVSRIASDAADDPLAVQRRSVAVTFEVADSAPLRARALRAAVQDARERARMVADASGVRLGRVLSVTEGGVTGALLAGTVPGGSQAAAMARVFGGSAASEQVETAAVVVVVEVDG